ncbi:hypothetical protein [Microcystis phage Mwe-JY08]
MEGLLLMSRHYAFPSAPSLGFNRSALPAVEAIRRVALRLWPIKPSVNVAQRAGVSGRAAEFWLSGEATGVSGDALAELLRSDVGFEILEEIMGDAKPKWWAGFRVAHKINELAKQQAETARSLEALRAQL